MKINRFNRWGLALFSIIGAATLTALALDKPGAGLAAACLPLFGIPVRKMDEFNGNPGGGGALPEGEFQGKVLGAIKGVQDQTKVIEGNFTRLDTESKKLAEDFAKQAKTFDGLPGQVDEISRSLKKIELKSAMERRSNFGSAVERLAADVEARNIINGVVRDACRKQGHHVKMTEAQEQAADTYHKALSDSASPGSTYINAELLPEIYSTIAEYGIWRNFDVVPVSSSSAKLIVDATDPTMYWTAENTAPTEGAITGSNVTATINKLLGWIQVSRELLDDAEIDLTAHILRKFANATAYGLDFACTSADGGADSTDGGFTGIFGGSGTAAVAASGNVSVATLDFEDILATMLAVDPAVLSRQTAAWFVHPQMLIRLMSIKDLNGRPIFLPAMDAPSFGAFGSILGYPVIPCHTANATDGVSKKIAVFGDRMGQAVCLRNDFEFVASDQAKFTEDSVVFRARARGAAKTKKATAFGVLTTAAS
jgi:HK97 family phage major capsid protein